MRSLAVGFLLLFSAGAAPFAQADGPPPAQPTTLVTHIGPVGNQLRTLLRSLDLIAKAHAAECKDEGELCKTNAECCPGLECSGDPQATCRAQE
jgi:hypothetical protein